ncbi:uncharacterized protein LOC107605779 [Arachis ipaensis]|uniref:uncharacterized protein LOC107605779 n=1 Tax=Arachis ipaensis TaxID=130454 RepID=UPI0007AF4A3F|nr:uncharacterized protein LOC107605779 [Arachis ipaensis]XP_025628133.1 uncharacterized protein LOC112721279 [Arachis hypogaea]
MRGNHQVSNFPMHSTVGNENRLRQNAGKQPQQIQVGPMCKKCEKDHIGSPCYFRIKVYYNCGEPGHIVSNCPKKPVQGVARTQQQRRVFIMTPEDAVYSDSLIQGQCYVKTRFITAFYNSGASHSFISLTVAREFGLDFSKLNFDLLVHTPTSQNVLTGLV